MTKSNDMRLNAGMLVGTVVIALVVMSAPTVLAASPHFIGTPTVTKNPDFSFQVKFKAAGLGNEAVNIQLTASGGTANTQCFNKGGNPPPPKTATFGPISSDPVTVTPRNGQVTATTNPLGPPPLPDPADVCPNPNWSVRFTSVTYTGVILSVDGLTTPINGGTVTVP